MSQRFFKTLISISALVIFSLALSSCATTAPHVKTSRKVARKKSVIAREIASEMDELRSEIRKSTDNATPQSSPQIVVLKPSAPKVQEAAAMKISAAPEPIEIDSSIADATETTAIGDADREPVPVLVNPEFSAGAIATDPDADVTLVPSQLKSLKNFDNGRVNLKSAHDANVVFEIPITYNERVRKWISYFQTEGRQSFRRYLERSTRWMPYIHDALEEARLPQDLMYVAMIESGFSEFAASPAHAVGMWQFIRPTANRYNLKTDWWIDERRDVYKSTNAAIAYMKDLHRLFGSWYLVAASYNMGEGGVQRLIKREGTNDFWELADRGVLPEETKNYVPKILAAMLIAKAPALYGFRDLQYHLPHVFDYYTVPGGTDLSNLAQYLGVSARYLQELNPELTHGFVPPNIATHKIRIPKGAVTTVAKYVSLNKIQ